MKDQDDIADSFLILGHSIFLSVMGHFFCCLRSLEGMVSMFPRI